MKFNGEKPQELGEKVESETGPEMPYYYWMQLANEMYERYGGKIRGIADEIIKKTDMPNGQYSVLFRNEDGILDIEKSKVFAQKVSNIAGLEVSDENEEKINLEKQKIDVEGPIISVDLRDYFETGMPEELKSIMSPGTVAFIENEFKIRKETMKKYGKNSTDVMQVDYPICYQKLSNDCDVILRGYAHDQEWHENFEESLTSATKYAKHIAIEGLPEVKFGKSLGLKWSVSWRQQGTFDKLMKQAVKNGFEGYFLEFDGRDESSVLIEGDINRKSFPNPPDSFFKNYLSYLHVLNPEYKEDIKDANDLREILKKLSLTDGGNLSDNTPHKHIFSQSYSPFVSLNKDGKYITTPNDFLFGQTNFSDALSALKMHFMNKLMEEGKIEKGLIVDYQGAQHLPLKSFYLKNTELAMMNVFQNIPHLIVSYLFKDEKIDTGSFEFTEKERQERFEKLNKELENIDFEKVLFEIGRLPAGKVEEVNEERDGVEINNRQRKLNMNEKEWNIFEMLNIDVKELAKKIKEIFNSESLK